MKDSKIYRYLSTIPDGKAVTYGHIARLFRTSPRNVGRLMSRNAHPDIYPCYKVIRSDGCVGGYTHNGKNDVYSARLKARKLKANGVKVNSGRVDASSIVR